MHPPPPVLWALISGSCGFSRKFFAYERLNPHECLTRRQLCPPPRLRIRLAGARPAWTLGVAGSWEIYSSRSALQPFPNLFGFFFPISFFHF